MRRFRPTPFRLAAAVVLAGLAFSGVAFAASLGVSSHKLHAWSQSLTKASCDQTYTTAYDTYVDQQNPSSTFGSATTLTVSGNGNKQTYAFIRFDLSSCNLPTTAGADTASLTIDVTATGKGTISLFPVTSTWDASTLSWSGLSGLTVGSTATTSFTPAATGSYTLTVTADVDAAIKAGTLWGWELRDTSSTKTSTIASSENSTVANRPTLSISDEK